MRKTNLLVTKLLTSAMLVALISFIHYSFFEPAKHGDSFFCALVLIITGIYFLLPSILAKLSMTIALAFYAIYVVVQVCYFKLFDQYLFINTAFNLFEEAADYTSDALDLVSGKEITVLAVTLVVILLMWIFSHKKSKYDFKFMMIHVLLGAICCTSAALLVMKQEQKIVDLGNDVFIYNQSDRYVYDKIAPKKTFVEFFGLEAFLYRDVKDHYLVNENEIIVENEKVTEFLNNNLPYQTNEYTGLFEGKQCFLIEAESLNMAAVDEVLTPTLYKLIHEGWYFSNFYSPTMTGSTSDVETMVNLSLIPINNGNIVSQRYAENEYPTTLAKGFASAGYVTNAYHNNFKVFYNRGVYFENLGYQTFLDSLGLGLESASSDKMVGEVLNWIPVYNDLDFSFWVTYSGHQPYLEESWNDPNQYSYEVQEEYGQYLEIVQQTYPELSINVQLYLAKTMSLDRALESYISTYQWMQRMDDLVIVIYGDHCVKMYNEEAEKSAEQILGRTLDDTPLAIWYEGIEPMTIEKYCTDIDLLPTLFNLYNIDYDKNTVLGNDIFDDRYHGFQFTTDWIISTDDYVYNSSEASFERLNISEEEAYESLNRYLEYQEISNLIYLNNYFSDEDELSE